MTVTSRQHRQKDKEIPEVTLSLVVGQEIQQAKKIPMNASGGGDYRRNDGAHCNKLELTLG